MTRVKTYALTKDAIGRFRTWASKADKRRDIFLCRRCDRILREGDLIVYKRGGHLGHLYCKSCAADANII